jgi:hypothetical protein
MTFKPTQYFFQFQRLLWCCVLSVSAASSAWADNGLNWKNGSDLLAVGLPALAAGAAWGQ